MSRLRAIIVDDEAPARERLRRLLGKREALVEVIGEAASADEAENLVHSSQVDLVFLDIVMPGRRDGFDLARDLGRRPAIVFTTAYAERSVEAFDTCAVHYLIKPIDLEKLDRALAKVQRITPKRFRTSIPCRLGARVELVPVDTILAFEADSKYTIVRTMRSGASVSPGEHIIDIPLVALEECLDPDVFVRASRGALVNVSKVRSFTALGDGRLELRFNEEPDLSVVVSRRHAAAFRTW